MRVVIKDSYEAIPIKRRDYGIRLRGVSGRWCGHLAGIIWRGQCWRWIGGSVRRRLGLILGAAGYYRKAQTDEHNKDKFYVAHIISDNKVNGFNETHSQSVSRPTWRNLT
jgi:hypothetical protein